MSKYTDITLGNCLLGERAAACLLVLMTGERGARAYYQSPTPLAEYGYYYESIVDRWIAFDNRAGTCYIEHYATEHEAKEALADGTELLAA